jgi:hypothetical protein
MRVPLSGLSKEAEHRALEQRRNALRTKKLGARGSWMTLPATPAECEARRTNGRMADLHGDSRPKGDGQGGTECPKRQPGWLFFGYFLLATHKFAWSQFEQPKAGPKGENQGRFS